MIIHPIGRPAIIIPTMPKTERMTDFMHIGLEGIAIQRGAVVGKPLGTYIHLHGGDATRPIPIAIGKGATLIIVKLHIGARGDLLKHQIGHIGPGLKGSARECPAFCCQRGQVIGDDVVAGRGPTMRAIIGPIASDQKIRDLIQGVGGRGRRGRGRGCRNFTDGKAITARTAIIIRTDIKIVSPGGRCGEGKEGIVIWPAIIILGHLITIGVTQPKIGVG